MCKYNVYTDEDLKKVAKDLYNGIIFSTSHLRASDNPSSHFMPLAFLPPSYPSDPQKTGDTKQDRDNKINDLFDRESRIKVYEADTKVYNDFISELGFVYADRGFPQSPMNINGYPVFYKCLLMSKIDSKKMFEFYHKYKQIRTEADEF